ncbi:MAG: hypothetical protein CM15mP127_15380 [Gammaproteobacteria bacterium]|nr:MAG: hypothetical protein CM15mP127_15380 [Gammaproteobacteria bacterium]
MRLTGYQGNQLIIFNGMASPGALEPFSWGNSQFFVTEGEGDIMKAQRTNIFKEMGGQVQVQYACPRS